MKSGIFICTHINFWFLFWASWYSTFRIYFHTRSKGFCQYKLSTYCNCFGIWAINPNLDFTVVPLGHSSICIQLWVWDVCGYNLRGMDILQANFLRWDLSVFNQERASLLKQRGSFFKGSSESCRDSRFLYLQRSTRINPFESTKFYYLLISAAPLLAQERCGEDVSSPYILILPLKGSKLGSDFWLSHHCICKK